MTLPEIAQKVKAVAVVPYWSYWLPSLLALLQILALLYMNTRVSATATSVEAAHVAINSERKAMQDELKKVHAVIVELTKENTALRHDLKEAIRAEREQGRSK